jgi:adenylate kinase family enzyme
MTRGIIIFGSQGAGKTTLGKLVSKELGYQYFDIDDYIWRTDTEKPYTAMYSREEKINRLMNDIVKTNYFVMAGSMDSFNQPFVPLFDLAVHLTASFEIREKRLMKRAQNKFGNRILVGGDLYEENRKFIKSAENYDYDGSPSYKVHKIWADSLPCKVLKLDGENSLKENMLKIIKEYKKIVE